MFYNDIKDDIDYQTPKPTIFRSIDWKIESIVDKILNIDKLNESEIKYIINRQHDIILNYDLFLASPDTRRNALILFTNKRFLKIFLEVIGIINLDENEIICLNKIAYDYYILPNKDPEVSDYLLQISYQINSVQVIKLSAILGINGARLLSIISNSTFKNEKKVHRVNTFLTKCDLQLTTQNVVDILCILYPRFTPCFVHSMLEEKPANLTQLEQHNFDAISNALIVILDSLTSGDIRKVLYDYAYILNLASLKDSVRFSLKSLSNYPRILAIINDIELDPIDTIHIP